jgi:hypothetical protein
MRWTEVIDSTNQIHAMLQRQCTTCQRPAPARQRGEAFTERRMQPLQDYVAWLQAGNAR